MAKQTTGSEYVNDEIDRIIECMEENGWDATDPAACTEFIRREAQIAATHLMEI